MQRRQARRWMAGVLLPILAMLGGCREPAREPTAAASLAELAAPGHARGRDLLLITLDTVRADHLGCYGNAEAETPNIDALASRGLRFTEVVTPAPMTQPAHASLLTGLEPPRHGVRDNGSAVLDARFETLAERLAAAGYATAGFVGAYVLDERFGLAQGFEHYDDEVAARIPGRLYFPERSAEAVTDAVLAWLAEKGSREQRPLFLWVHYFDSHLPYDPPEPFASRFAEDPYAGEIARVDAQLGRLLEALRGSGRLDRTLVVLTADHGEGLGEHGELSHELLTYETTLHVPLIISGPGLFTREIVVDDRVVSLIDVLPLTLDLLGVAHDAGELDGLNVAGAADAERAVYFESLAPLHQHGWAPLHGLRRVRDKFIEAPEPEYFRLDEDRSEEHNRFSEAPEALALRERLRREMSGQEASAPTLPQLPLDPEVEEQLAALGYVHSPVKLAAGEPRPNPKQMLPLWERAKQAMALAQQRRMEEAEREIREVLKADPGNGSAWYYAGHIYRNAGQLNEAEACLRNGVRLWPHPGGYAMLAEVLVGRRQPEAALEVLDEAEALDLGDGALLLARGHALLALGRRDEAREAWEAAGYQVRGVALSSRPARKRAVGSSHRW